MTAEIINLRKARKAKARSAKEDRATENRAAFGRTKAERQAQNRAQSKIDRELDGARIISANPDEDQANSDKGE